MDVSIYNNLFLCYYYITKTNGCKAEREHMYKKKLSSGNPPDIKRIRRRQSDERRIGTGSASSADYDKENQAGRLMVRVTSKCDNRM